MSKAVTPNSSRKRINSISLPFGIGGVGWEILPSVKEHLHDLIVFLSDRRVLYQDVCREIDTQSATSVLRIREELVSTKQKVKGDPLAFSSLSVMQMACRKFLNDMQAHGGDCKKNQRCYGEFRSSVGREIAYLSAYYDIPVEGELTEILPPEIIEE